MFIKVEKRDWGKGVPMYAINDLMSEYELYDFGLDVICDYLQKEGYAIVAVNDKQETLPSIVAKDNDQLLFVLVESDIAKNQPKISNERKSMLINHSKKFEATCYYASCSFGSIDPERFDKGIALRGDGYYCNFTGLELLQ